ncbi:zinc-dependent metalloprotease [Streptomyces sp. NPDC052114]|uniref:zinc-dependent metalloprotease n=1 Tax=unclassified Streptomyces TaxID=2593676 RepID=UPI0034268662
MTTCDISRETDQLPELSSKISLIAEQVAPVLEDIIELSLGRPLLRIVGPEEMIAAVMEERHRIYALDATQFNLAFQANRALDARLRSREEDLRRFWMGGAFTTVTNEFGEPEVLIVPEALHHSGAGTDMIAKGLAQALTHVAQHQASDGRVTVAYHTGRPDLRGFNSLAIAHLVHGHAGWADRQVTTKLLGHEVEPEPTGRETPEFLAMMQALRERLQDPTAPAPSAAPPEAFDEGLRWVTEVIDLLGVTSFNRIWGHPRYAPTHQEIQDPALWARRMLNVRRRAPGTHP